MRQSKTQKKKSKNNKNLTQKGGTTNNTEEITDLHINNFVKNVARDDNAVTKWYFKVNKLDSSQNDLNLSGSHSDFIRNFQNSANLKKRQEWILYVAELINILKGRNIDLLFSNKSDRDKSRRVAELLERLNNASFFDLFKIKFFPDELPSLNTNTDAHVVTYDVNYTYSPVPLTMEGKPNNKMGELSGIELKKYYNDGDFVKLLEAVYGTENNFYLTRLLFDDKDKLDEIKDNTVTHNIKTTSLIPTYNNQKSKFSSQNNNQKLIPSNHIINSNSFDVPSTNLSSHIPYNSHD